MASTSTYRLRGSTSVDTSASSSPGQFKYDVFLSFRGKDTRRNFTDHLYDKLRWRGIKAFRDDPDLDRGTVISSELFAAIEQSRFAVVVLSPNYASSSWCLLELAKIVACMGERRTILPVFIDVDPSDIRHQTGSFKETFAEHEDKFADDLSEVQEWRDALRKVADVAGWSSKDYRYETELIKEIVEALWKKVSPTLASSESESVSPTLASSESESLSLQNLVGIDSKLMEIEFLLDTNGIDVCFLKMWGVGGIGKTTLARQVHNKISHHFEVTIFLPDVRQISTTHGLVHQQEQLLCQVLKEKSIQVHNVYDGVAKIKRCLFEKKVLLVLDDVDKSDQLENLAGGKDWFGSGSIIIMTTRDQHLLVSHGVEKRYECKRLNPFEALQLFSWKAFKKYYPEEGYMELSKSILDYSRGLPLALKILGSFLYKRDRGDWESTVANLKRAPINQVLFRALEISYDGLNEIDQQVFLDVACFLKGYHKERVVEILNSCFGFDTRIMMSVLIEKSLITIFDNRVDMHDLIQEMGREIVRLESEHEPGKRSQLWLHDDILQVLKENTGTQAIRSIAICLPKFEELAWNPDAFSSMYKLKFIKMQNLVLCPGPKYLPRDLRVLEWNLYPAESLPLNFQPLNLIELILHHSKIHHLWHGIKYLNKLTIMDLSFSDNLTETPDFTGIQNLERLVLEGCTNLVYIHPSITSVRRLKILSLKNCRSITSFPGELEMDSLELLDLSGCSRVNILPQRVHRLSLVLASLKYFRSLKRLHLNDCKLEEGDIPDYIGCLSSLEDLDLSANNFISLPASISQLSRLTCLNLTNCRWLELLPCLPLFSGTCDVTADNCISLKKFPDSPDLYRLWKLSLNFINCWSTVQVQDVGVKSISHAIIYSMIQRFLQEPPPFFEIFSTVIPGEEIPRWFRNRSQSTVTVTAPELGCPCRYKWMGYALCVLFGAAKNPDVLSEDHDLELHANTIRCSWKPGASFSSNLNQVLKSDHLCLFLLPPRHYHGTIRFVFETLCATEGNSYLKVKGCGVRALYEQEVKELDFRMNQNNKFPDMAFCSMQLSRRCRHHPFSWKCSFVISGKVIPEWFEYRSELVSEVSVDLPCSSCRSTWMGFVLCVLFEAEENPGGLCDLNEPHVISCCWGCTYNTIHVDQVVQLSDQLCVFFTPAEEFVHLGSPCEFHFKTRCANSNLCLKVKRCGIRRLYEDDLQNPYIKETEYMSYRDQVADWIEELSSLIKCRVVNTPTFTRDGEGGSNFAAPAAADFGVDPNIDLELKLALEVSMEEERARQEAAAIKASDNSSKQDKGGEEAPGSQDATMTELRANAVTPETANKSIDFMAFVMSIDDAPSSRDLRDTVNSTPIFTREGEARSCFAEVGGVSGFGSYLGLKLALEVSMEEERARQEAAAIKAADNSSKQDKGGEDACSSQDATMTELCANAVTLESMNKSIDFMALVMSMDDPASSHDLRDTVESTPIFTRDGEAGSCFVAVGGVSGFGSYLGLKLALEVSMEEERARQEAAAIKAADDSSKQDSGGEEAPGSQDATMPEMCANAATPETANKSIDFMALVMSMDDPSSSYDWRDTVESTPIFTGDGEAGSSFAAAGGVSGFDLDLELKLALELSMEEERARQEAAAKKAAGDSSKQDQ